MPGVLDGVRVIDFGQYIAGPLAAMLLADQGAEVIRVEVPGGPRLHTPANGIWNRGKRSIELDLKQEGGIVLDFFAGNDQLKANAVLIFRVKGVAAFKTV